MAEHTRPWTWILVLGVVLGLFEATRRAVLATDNPRLLPAMVLFGALVVPATFLAFVWGRPVAHDVTPAVIGAVATGGGCLSLVLAAVLEDDALRGTLLGARDELPLPAVGFIEEASKLLVVLVVLLLAVPATPLNGLLVGVAVGTGFAVLETLGYAFAAYVREGGGLAALDDSLLLRSLYTPSTHVAWAGLAGCALGYAAMHRWRPMALLVAVGTFVLVAGVHTLWDQHPGPLYWSLTVVDLGLLALAVVLVPRVGVEPTLSGF